MRLQPAPFFLLSSPLLSEASTQKYKQKMSGTPPKKEAACPHLGQGKENEREIKEKRKRKRGRGRIKGKKKKRRGARMMMKSDKGKKD